MKYAELTRKLRRLGCSFTRPVNGQRVLFLRLADFSNENGQPQPKGQRWPRRLQNYQDLCKIITASRLVRQFGG